jgi:hypothetical protein
MDSLSLTYFFNTSKITLLLLYRYGCINQCWPYCISSAISVLCNTDTTADILSDDFEAGDGTNDVTCDGLCDDPFIVDLCPSFCDCVQ